VTGGSRNLRIGPPQAPRHFHLDITGDIEHDGNTVRGLLCGQFFRIVVNRPGQRDDSLLYSHADVALFETRIPVELK
jgi:hypothetical protein